MDTAQARAEAALRRDATLEAVAFAAHRFLKDADWERSIPQVLRRLGEAAAVGRVSVLRCTVEGNGDLGILPVHEWCADGVRPVLSGPWEGVTGSSWRRHGFDHMITVLGRGDLVQGHVRDFPEAERAVFEARGIHSLILVPVFAGPEWWGLISFDQGEHERVWSQVEIDALRTTAGSLGAAIERGRAERLLREAEERYRQIVEQTPAITYQEHASKEYSVDGAVMYVSPQVERLLGYSPETWRSPGFWMQATHPDDLDAVIAESERTARTGEPYSQEYRVIAADGRVVWFRDEAVLIRDEQGRPTHWRGLMLDITEHKQTEDQLRQSEARLRDLVENMPAVTYRERLDASVDHFYMSPQVHALFGYTPEEWTSSDSFWFDHVHPDDLPAVEELDRATNETGEPFAAEYRLRRADGSYVWIEDQASLIGPEEGPRFWQGFMFDVTARKQAEERLAEALEVEREATQRLRSLDAMKNTFLQAVSHDLRTPLAAILGLAITLERAEIDLPRDESRDLARRIATNARKLDRLVNDLLDLDRLSRGIVEPKLYPVDVGALVMRVAGDPNVTADRRITVEAPEVVASVDAAKVERIVENLLSNALRHTSPSTRVWARVVAEPTGVLLLVEDEGPGVPEDIREEIFEPFRQGPNAPQHSPGVGVGLALVRRFAELHDGRAWVDEREGGGASFRVFLPDPSVAAAG